MWINYGASYMSQSKVGMGSVYGEDGKVTLTGKKAGTCKMVAAIDVYTNDRARRLVKSFNLTCNVTITDPNPKKIPLQSISMTNSAVSAGEGKLIALGVKFNPVNTTDRETVTWTSSNTSVATVNSTGMVTTKKAGVATITAKVGTKTASCKVTVTSSDRYLDVSAGYSLLNQFRTTKNVWQWNKDNRTKTYFN